MRLLHCALVTVAFFAASSMSHAQSAYDYPWCALFTRTSGATSCYFQSYQQCMATLSGIGGVCIRSPYYHGPGPGHGRTQE